MIFPFWALDLDAPLTIEAGGPPAHAELAPASMWAKYTYGQRGDRAPLSLTWYQGVEKPKMWASGEIPQWGSGVLFVGDDGPACSPTTESMFSCRRRNSRSTNVPRRVFRNRWATIRNGFTPARRGRPRPATSPMPVP